MNSLKSGLHVCSRIVLMMISHTGRDCMSVLCVHDSMIYRISANKSVSSVEGAHRAEQWTQTNNNPDYDKKDKRIAQRIDRGRNECQRSSCAFFGCFNQSKKGDQIREQ